MTRCVGCGRARGDPTLPRRRCEDVPVEPTPGYREFRPPAPIREAVECLWVRTNDSGESVHVLPDGCVDVVWRRGAGTTVAGPDTSAKVVTRESGDLLVGLRLRPGAGGEALGVPLDELRDLRVEAAEL